MARLREGRANTARGAAHFLRETVGRVRAAGASGRDGARRQRLLQPRRRRRLPQAGCPLLNHHSPAAERHADRGDSGRGGRRSRTGCRAAVAETTYTPFQHKEDATPVRLIVRRVKPAPGSQLALFVNYSYHAFISDRAGELLELEADHRRHAEIENAIRDLKYGVGLNHLPSGASPRTRMARCAGDRAQPRPLDGAAGARRGNRRHQDAQAALRRRTITHSARRWLHLPKRWPWAGQWAAALVRLGLTPAHSAGPAPSRQHARARLAHPRAPPSAPPMSDGSSHRPRHRPSSAATPAELSASPAARPVKLDRWIHSTSAGHDLLATSSRLLARRRRR